MGDWCKPARTPRNENILKEAIVESIAVVIRRMFVKFRHAKGWKSEVMRVTLETKVNGNKIEERVEKL